MVNDLKVSEKRLLAAFGRLDELIERGLQPESGQSKTLSDELGRADQRLVEAGQEIAQLAAANDSLTKANRQLLERLEAGGDSSEDRLVALEAELSALHAARAAEAAQVMDILERLDRAADQGRSDESQGQPDGDIGATISDKRG